MYKTKIGSSINQQIVILKILCISLFKKTPILQALTHINYNKINVYFDFLPRKPTLERSIGLNPSLNTGDSGIRE